MITPVSVSALEVQALDAKGNELTTDDWLVRSFELHEKISEPYSLKLELATEDLDLFVPGLVGGRCVLRFERDKFDRAVRGIVFKADTLGIVRKKLHVRLWVAPSLQILGNSKRRRIFQGMTAVEIVQELLSPVLEQYGGSLDVTPLQDGTLRRRDYCVQIDETDLQFVQRLLAEEALTFSFRHGGEVEEMVLMPMTAIFHSAAGEDEVGPRTVKVRSRNPDELDEETVQSLQGSARMRANRTEVSMWDWKSTTPSVKRESQDPFADDPDLPRSFARFGEIYEHESYRPVEEEEGGPLFEQNAGEANSLAHQRRLDDVRASGASNIVGFTDGATFDLTEHPIDELDGLYALLSVSHFVEFGDLENAKALGHAGSYSNRFACFRFASAQGDQRHTFAPPRRPKPVAPGPETAIVVGPEKEEIYTDEHGRIKVLMRWDREGAERGHHETSCWVPVAQTWGGPGYGAVFIPRVGMEVVISFVAGDPDRPMCTGVVYNGLNTPPYPLPDNKTRSVIKTSSSPGGDGFNELSFEDAAGGEEIFLHAQKNLREVVKASHTTSVGGSQSNSVGGDQSVSVSGKQTNTVEKDQIESVTGNVTLTVEAARESTITGKETLTLLDARDTWITKTETHQVTEMLTEVFDGGRTTVVAKGDGEKVTVGDKSVEVVEGYFTVAAKTKIALAQSESHNLVLEDNATLSTSTDFTVTNGKVSVSSDGGALKLSAADELSLTCGTASIVLKKDGTIDIQGSSKVAVGTPGTSFTAEPAGAAINSAKIVAAAVGVHEVKGALVKIN